MHILARRVFTAIPTLLLLSLFIFLLLELAPGDAADVLIDQAAAPEAQAALRAELGLEQPLLPRFFHYLDGLLHGDLGVSARTGRDVADEILLRLPYTLVLAGAGLALGVLVGGGLGALAAVNRGTRWDMGVRALVSLNMAVPTFWLALVLVGLFAVKLRWVPVFGAESAAHLVLPAICAAFPLIPGTARLTRSSLLEALHADFVLVARGKGLRQRALLLRHIAPVAAIPVITYIGLQAVHLVGGLIIVETIFNWPGLGGLAVQAAFDRDPLLLQGAALTIAALSFVILFVVDVGVLVLDPRISTRAA